MSDEVRQIFIRNDKGKVWGPLTLATIELLVENGLIDGKLQVSEDGIRYADPGRFPHLRAAFPQELWGNTAPGETVPLIAAPPPVMASEDGSVTPGGPPVLGGPTPVPGTLRAGPGATASAPRAGPGIANAARAVPGGTRPAAARPSPP